MHPNAIIGSFILGSVVVTAVYIVVPPRDLLNSDKALTLIRTQIIPGMHIQRRDKCAIAPPPAANNSNMHDLIVAMVDSGICSADKSDPDSFCVCDGESFGFEANSFIVTADGRPLDGGRNYKEATHTTFKVSYEPGGHAKQFNAVMRFRFGRWALAMFFMTFSESPGSGGRWNVSKISAHYYVESEFVKLPMRARINAPVEMSMEAYQVILSMPILDEKGLTGTILSMLDVPGEMDFNPKETISWRDRVKSHARPVR